MARVAGISPASVQRICAANDIKPHLTRTFKLSNHPNFEEKFWDVIGLYLNPPSRACLWASVISVHNHTIMSGTAQSLCSLRWTIFKGRLISTIESQHRHQEWLEFLKKINRETPKSLQLHLIVDNYVRN